ncbi:MAG TPA: amylo-alpha-1,6-glucosidase [bacterium]|nr:amylo-alpha-1,6-glucosidase [bacterium]
MSRWSFEEQEGREWLEANGLGGYASSTLSGANSRRYHGVLVAAMHPPLDRRVLLSKLEESLCFGGGRHELSCNRFPGHVTADGGAALASYERGIFPVMEFEVPGARLRKTVAAVHNENSTLICYELLAGPADLRLQLKPLLAPRGIHSLAKANSALRWDHAFADGLLRLSPYEGCPEIFIRVPGAGFASDPQWCHRFQYQRELERGLDFEEDLFSYGSFELGLEVGKPVLVMVSTQDPSGRDAGVLWRAEKDRRTLLQAPLAGRAEMLRRLALAADQFLARRGADQETVIAGYPWFEDWGRDTMISLRGLCLATGRPKEARGILASFLKVLDRGMLPNRFPEAGSAPEYNSVDATLWLFVAAYDYQKNTGDSEFVLGNCLPALLDVLDWHRRGPRFGIRVAEDGLLEAGSDGTQLTWMDAKVGDRVVTPRRGKPVEVNALWYNALRIAQEFSRAAGREDLVKDLSAQADRVRAAFEQVFWNAEEGCCYDAIGAEGPDPSVRPNQIFCLSLPFPLLDADKSRLLLETVEAQLLTPRGLRSLSPRDTRYVPRYQGGVSERDGAYHQGTVWAWLLGPMIEAMVRVRGEAGKEQARALLRGFEPHLEEAGLGTVSEIFDAEAPHAPRGCPAQAWSVAELLRVGLDLL